MGRCITTPHVEDKQGNWVPSKLFGKLRKVTKNYATAKRYYNIAVNDQKWRDNYYAGISTDEYGEPTLGSLFMYTDLDSQVDTTIEVLNEELGAEIYEDMNNAAKSVGIFNKNNKNPNYSATIRMTDDGKYSIQVEPSSTLSRTSTVHLIREGRKRARLIRLLEQAGVKVGYIKKGNFDGKYSSTPISASSYADNGVNMENGAIPLYSSDVVYTLIQLCEGNSDNYTLAIAAGHFTIDGLGHDHVLVQRLFNSIRGNEKLQKKLLGDSYDSMLEADAIIACAGILVGNQIAKKTDVIHNNLITRIIQAFRKILSKISRGKLGKIINESPIIAERIADGFISPDWEGSIDNVLNYDHTFIQNDNYLENKKLELRKFKSNTNNADKLELYEDFKTFMENISGVSSEHLKKHIKEFQHLENLYHNTVFDNQVLTSAMFFNELVRVLNNLKDITLTVLGNNVIIGNEIIEGSDNRGMLYDIKYAREHDPLDYNVKGYEYAKKLRIVGAYLVLFGNIVPKVNKAFSGSESDEHKELKETMAKMSTAMNKYLEDYKTEAQYMILNTFSNIYGKSSIEITKRRLFSRGRQKKLNAFLEKNEGKISLKEAIFNPDEFTKLIGINKDISWIQEMLSMAHSNPSIAAQLLYNALQKTERVANEAALYWKNEIENLEEEFRNGLGKFINKSDLYEKDENGKLTGYYISRYNYGSWDNERLAEMDRLRKAFIKLHYDKLNSYTFQEDLEDYIKIHMKNWHIRNSFFDPNTKKYSPNDNYLSDDFIKLENKIKNKYKGEYPENYLEDYIKKIVKLKSELESRTVNNYGIKTDPMRTPQFRATFTNSVQNKKMQYGSLNVFKTYLSSFREWVHNLFWREDTDMDNGVDSFEDSQNYKFYSPGARHQVYWGAQYKWSTSTRMYKLPAQGIKKLSNMDQLSTDLFGSLETYAYCMCNYAAKERVVDQLEIGREALQHKKEKMETKGRELNSYTKMLNRLLYQESFPKIGKNLAVEKVVGALRSFGVFYTLANNLRSSTKNMVSNFVRHWSMAASNKDIDFIDFLKANHEFYKYWTSQNVIQGFKNNKKDLPSKLLRKFGMKGNFLEEISNNRRGQSRATKFLKKSPYLLYSASDHYHQSIELLNSLISAEVYIKDKKNPSELIKTNLYSIYKDQHNNNKRNELQIPKHVYLYESGLKDEQFINEIIEKLESEDIDTKIETEKYNKIKELYYKYRSNIQENFDILIANNATLRYILEKIKLGLTVSELYESKLVQEAQRRNDLMFGAYRSSTLTAYQSDPILRLSTGIKGYAYGYAGVYFTNPSSTNITTEKDMESWFLSILKLITSASEGTLSGAFKKDSDRKDINILDLILIGAIPFTARIPMVRQRALDAEFSETQLDNIFQAKAVLMAAVVLKLLASLVLKFYGPEDEEDELEKLRRERRELQKLLEEEYKKGENKDSKLIAKTRVEILRLEKKIKIAEHKKEIELRKNPEYLNFKIENLRRKAKGLPTIKWEDTQPVKQPENKFWGCVYYILAGAAEEQDTFYDPITILNEVSGLADPTPTGLSAYVKLAEIAYLAAGAYFDDDTENTDFYWSKRSIFHDKGDPKYIEKFLKSAPGSSDIFFINNPWETTENAIKNINKLR